MCGRYALYGPQSRLREQFDFGFEEIDEAPRDLDRYNIAPTQTVLLLRTREDGVRELIHARWGLLPSWVKEPGRLAQPINAKIETAAEKPMFRHAFKKSRVLVPASGFYEWKSEGDHKQPFFIHPVDMPFFGFGGLLEHWDGPDGPVRSFAILTTAANTRMAPIHDRMPVILAPEDYAVWLDPGLTDAARVHALAGPYAADRMEADPVGRAVGNPRSQGAGLIERVSI